MICSRIIIFTKYSNLRRNKILNKNKFWTNLKIFTKPTNFTKILNFSKSSYFAKISNLKKSFAFCQNTEFYTKIYIKCWQNFKMLPKYQILTLQMSVNLLILIDKLKFFLNNTLFDQTFCKQVIKFSQKQ